MSVTGLFDEDLLDPIARANKAAIYGDQAIAEEIARRARHRSVNLRGEDLPPPADDWECSRRDAREWDPVAHSGTRATMTQLGSEYDRETRRRAQAKAIECQKSQWAIAQGATVIFKGGKVARSGDAVELADVGAGEHSIEVVDELVRRGVVIEIDEHTAWLRSLPAHIGPYVVVREVDAGDRRFQRGESISEADFPEPERPRQLAPGDRLSELTVRDIERLITGALARAGLIPALAAMPPVSIFNAAIQSGRIEIAPNFDPCAPPPASTPPPSRRGVLGRLTGAARKAGR